MLMQHLVVNICTKVKLFFLFYTVFDSDHLEHDDNDDYSDQDDDEDSYHGRPKLGLDLSNLFLPIGIIKL